MTEFNFPSEPIRWCDPLHQAVDLRLVAPEQNFGSRSVAREVNAIYEDIQRQNVIWQPDVYAEARSVADRNGIKRIVDVGCGNGSKLVNYFPKERFHTTGLDFRESLALARGLHPDSNWVDCDLNSSYDLATVFNEADFDEPTLLILSDVIEHLPDPRMLVAQLRAVLLRHAVNRLVLSTPDRALINYKYYGANPGNGAHVREWTHSELGNFCRAAGFQIECSGYTRANQFDERYSTIYMQLRCDYVEYTQFLQSKGLLHDKNLPRHLLVTSEFAGLHITGGIGTFVAEQRLAYGSGNTLTLFIGHEHELDDDLFSRLHLIKSSALIDEVDLSLATEEIALKAVFQLLFYFPGLTSIEYADYQGLGCRIAQAKRANLFPPSVQVVAHCHGATHYLENAQQAWFGISHLNVAEREKISIENADVVVFPTKFLCELYREVGIRIDEGRGIHLRYPYQFEQIRIERTERADTLVFYGKRSTMKGYSLFLAALAGDDGQLVRLGIKRIVLIGPRVAETTDDVTRLDVLRSRFIVEEFTSLSRTGAMDKLRNFAANALCVMPYLGDNYPYALLDVVFVGVLPLMLRAGGVPEVFAEPFDNILLADPTESALLLKVRALVKLSVEERHRLRTNFLDSMICHQESINSAVRRFSEVRLPTAAQPASGSATVIVPVFNTDLCFISDLVFGLNNQSMSPVEVIFVDDGSRQGYVRDLDELLRRDLNLPYRIVSHRSNMGLAAARNTGLNLAGTDYVINIDSDDVPLNDFVRNIVRRLDADPRCVAAVPYLKAFDENSPFNEQVFGGYVYRPIGDGVIASQLDNNLGHANSGYRANVLREFGGWEDGDRSMWEDWALFLKIVSLGHRIGVIPQVDCLYRVRKHSMLRTYKAWPAMRRLARNMEGLPRFENFRLQAVMRRVREEEGAMRADVARLTMELQVVRAEVARYSEECGQLTAELNRRSVRAVRSVTARLARFPLVFLVLRRTGLVLWKAARWIRSFVRAG